MAHRNAPLTPTGRLRLARCVVEDGWPLRRAAERFQVAPTTAKRWADRYREHGAAGMSDHSSRPHHSPRRLPHTPSGASWDYGCGSGSARPASPPGWV